MAFLQKLISNELLKCDENFKRLTGVILYGIFNKMVFKRDIVFNINFINKLNIASG